MVVPAGCSGCAGCGAWLCVATASPTHMRKAARSGDAETLAALLSEGKNPNASAEHGIVRTLHAVCASHASNMYAA